MTLWDDVFNVGLDCYDETDAEPERPTQSASAEQPDVDLSFTQTDNADQEPSYGDFLIAYSTQSGKFNIVEWVNELYKQFYCRVALFM